MKPILFNAEMVRAILEGRKTVTRRPIKPQPPESFELHPDYADCAPFSNGRFGFCDEVGQEYFSPYIPKENLWIREPAVVAGHVIEYYNSSVKYKLLSDRVLRECKIPKRLENEFGAPPQWAYHLKGVPNGCIKEMAQNFIEVISCIPVRLQDITEEEVKREGLEYLRSIPDFDETLTDKDLFEVVWDSLYAKKGLGWVTNPWVWRIEFKLKEVK